MTKSRRARLARKRRLERGVARSRNHDKSSMSTQQRLRSLSKSYVGFDTPEDSYKQKLSKILLNATSLLTAKTSLDANERQTRRHRQGLSQSGSQDPTLMPAFVALPKRAPSFYQSGRRRRVSGLLTTDNAVSQGPIQVKLSFAQQEDSEKSRQGANVHHSTPCDPTDHDLEKQLNGMTRTFSYSCFSCDSNRSLTLKSHDQIEAMMPLKETKARVESFISALRYTNILSDKRWSRLQLSHHISNAFYTQTIIDTHICTLREVVPEWFKTDVRQMYKTTWTVGSIDGLDGVGGFGIAWVRHYVWPGSSILDIYCFPHYRHFQWRYKPIDWVGDCQISLFDWIHCLNRSLHPKPEIWKTQWLDLTENDWMEKNEDEPLEQYQCTTADLLEARNSILGRLKFQENPEESRAKYARVRERCIQTEDAPTSIAPIKADRPMPSCLQRYQISEWKHGPGRKKSWKVCKVIKMNGRKPSSWGSSSTNTLIRKSSMLQVPRYLWSLMGYNIQRCWNFRVRVRPVSQDEGDNTAIDFAFRSKHSCPIHEVNRPNRKPAALVDESDPFDHPSVPSYPIFMVRSPPRSIRQLFPSGQLSVPGHNILRLGTYSDLVIAPCYLLRRVRSIDLHVSIFESTDLNDATVKYVLTAVNTNIPDMASNGHGLYRYRLKVVKRLQKRPDYLDTLGQYGLIWIVQRHTPVMPAAMHYSKCSVESNQFLKRGSREFKEAFPLLPRTSKQKQKTGMAGNTLNHSRLIFRNVVQRIESASSNGVMNAKEGRAEKEREAQRRRRMFRREWARIQTVVRSIQ